MEAVGRDEAQLRPVRAPQVLAHVDVVFRHRAMEVRRHQQARHLAGVDVDDDAADHGDVGIAGERILPRAEHRVAAVDRRLDQVHVADLALVLLLRRDLLAVGRPRQRRRGAGRPAGVAGRVAEVLRAVGRELALLAGGDVAHPEIPVADEQRLGAVGRHRRRRRTGHAGDVGSAGLRERDAAAPHRRDRRRHRRRVRPPRPPAAGDGLAAGGRRRNDFARLLHRIDDDVFGAGQRSSGCTRSGRRAATWHSRCRPPPGRSELGASILTARS